MYKKFIIFLLLTLSTNVFPSVFTVLELTGVATSSTSRAASSGPEHYSIQCSVAGATFDIDLKVQVSLDNTTWTNLSGFTTNLTSAQTIVFDVSNHAHISTRVVATRNSGTYDLTCKMNN